MKKLLGIKKFIVFVISLVILMSTSFYAGNYALAENNDIAIIRKHQETQNKIKQLKTAKTNEEIITN